MASLRIKAYGLNRIDRASLKSMLSLAHKSLNDSWEIVEKGDFNLSIYSLESDEGQSAWQQHQKGLCAILTKQEEIPDNADIILKKPLRTKNFSEVLNTIANQIENDIQTNITEKTEAKESHPAPEKTPKKQAKKSSFLSNLSQLFTGKKTPDKDLPNLNFKLPEQSSSSPNTITDPELLSQWFAQLPENDNDKIISAILGNLVPLNRAKIPANKRLTLLDIYRRPIRKLIFNRNLASIQRELSSPSEFLKAINSLSLLLEELIIGYKIIVNEAYQTGANPNSNDPFLIVISRVSELISLLVLHNYRYYRSPSVGTIHDLHQLYIYCEASNTLNKIVSIKETSIDHSFYHSYCQIMLTNIADPYSLEKYDIFRLFNLMEKIVSKVEITRLTDEQIKTNSQFQLAANFCIDCTNDQPPVSLSSVAIETRSLPQARLLNTHQVLQAIEDMTKSAQKGAYNLDYQLLQKITPQIDASYQRKYPRMPSIKPRRVNIANGVASIYYCLNNNDFANSLEWNICNQSDGGIMASRKSDRYHQLNIGDFVGIFETDSPPLLTVIRWLHTDNDNTTRIGLELHSESPSAVTFTPDGETEIFQGLLLAEIDDIDQGRTLIVNKGVYSNNRVFRIKEGNETYTIIADNLINHTLHYEQFSFQIKASS